MEQTVFSAFTGSFYKAPISRLLLYGSIGGYAFISYPAQKYLPLLSCNFSNVIEQKQIWRMPVSKLFFSDAKCLFLTVILLFHFKKFEKRYGSAKFLSYLMGVFLITQALECAAIYTIGLRGITLNDLPTGLISVIISLFIPFYKDIPRVTRASIMGIPISGKAMAYICGLQIASSSKECLLLTGIGLLSGLLYRANILWMKSWAVVPRPISSLFHTIMSPVLAVQAPSMPSAYGATLELQRIEEEDRIEQALLLANIRRNQHPLNNAQGGLFSHLFRDQAGGDVAAPVEPSIEQVETLTNMGFARERAIEALRVCRNDINQATNHLLMST